MRDDSNPGGGADDRHDDPPQSQQVRHSNIGAIVPEHVARGVFSTGAVVLNGAHEFIIDFLLRMTKPHQVAARVVLPPAVLPRMVIAMQENLHNYEKRFGPIPAPPTPKPQPELDFGVTEHTVQPGQAAPEPAQPQQLSAEELYEQLKFADEDLSGTYANAVMIGHTGTEFSFDFITTFFPRSVVCKRVFLAAPNVPRFLESLQHSFEQYRRKLAAAGAPTPPPLAEFGTRPAPGSEDAENTDDDVPDFKDRSDESPDSENDWDDDE